MTPRFMITAVAMGAIAFSTTTAFALGGGSSSSSSTTPSCSSGFKYNKQKKRCVKAKTRARGKQKCPKKYIYNRAQKRCVRNWSYVVPDNERKAQGWKLAYAGKYHEAIKVFSSVHKKDDPEALNGLGFSHRKLGRLTDGFAFYHKALTIDPNYLLAREYLGEGYVAAGRLDLAKRQLAEIKKRGGSKCIEYTTLAKVISKTGHVTW